MTQALYAIFKSYVLHVKTKERTPLDSLCLKGKKGAGCFVLASRLNLNLTLQVGY